MGALAPYRHDWGQVGGRLFGTRRRSCSTSIPNNVPVDEVGLVQLAASIRCSLLSYRLIRPSPANYPVVSSAFGLRVSVRNEG